MVVELVKIFDVDEFSRKLSLPTKKSCDKWDVEEVFALLIKRRYQCFFLI